MNARCEIDDHAGIVATDPQLRTATLQVTNDYPCAVTGYWSLSIPSYYYPGYYYDGLGSEVRGYRQVGSAWQEVFGGEQFVATIGAGQTLEVSLLLEGAGWSSDATLSATFHAVNLADEAPASGLLPGYEARDSLTLEVNAVDLAVGSMPAVYEDTLASVIPCNKDYDCGYEDGSSNPLPDNTAPLPTGATPPPAHAGEDDLPAGSLTFPYGFHGTWTMTVPAGLRVWQWTGSAWAEVQSGTAYARSGGGGIGLRVEGLAAGASAYLTVSAQFTDTNDNAIGLPLVDQVKVEVVSVDLQIQDISEYDEATKPAFVIVNDDYDEGNVHPISGEAVMDNGRLNDEIVSVPPGIVASDDDLVSGSLTIVGPSGQHGKWWIEVTGEPCMLDDPGDPLHPYPGYDQYLRVWLPDGTPVPTDAASALPITLNAQAVDLLIEGLAAYYSESSPIRLTAHFEPDGDYPFAAVLPVVSDTTKADTLKVGLMLDGWDINGQHHIQVKAGDRLTLSVEITPSIESPACHWSFGSGVGYTDVVKDFDGTRTSDPVTYLGPGDYDLDSFTFVWVAGGDDREVDVTVGDWTLKTWFDIDRPVVGVTATANRWTTIPGGDNGVNVCPAGGYNDFLLQRQDGTVNGMTFQAAAKREAGFTYEWCQVVNYFYDVYTGAPAHSTNLARDGEFPYSDDPATTNDSPGYHLETSAVTGTGTFTASLTMWYMAKPDDPDSIWIPLSKYQWNVSFSFAYDNATGEGDVTNATHTGSGVFTVTTDYPSWLRVYPPG